MGIICERYWLLDLALTFEQHMELPPKKEAMPTYQRILHAWSMRFLYDNLAHMVVGTTLHR